MVLFCRACDSPNEFDRNWVTDQDECGTCGARKKWRTLNEPKKPWELNEMDKRFLKAIRVIGE